MALRRIFARYRRGFAWSTGTSAIIVETGRHRITGLLRLPADGYRSRLTDYLNASERVFLALTDVEVTSLDGPHESSNGTSSPCRCATSCWPCRPRRGRASSPRKPPRRDPIKSAQLAKIWVRWPPDSRRTEGHEPHRALRASPRMFDSDLLDKLSRVHPAVPPILFGAGDRDPRGRGVRARRGLADPGLGARRLPVLDPDRVLAAPDRLPLRAREGHRRAAALDHPRRPPRSPQ